jgi:hypothetical protein
MVAGGPESSLGVGTLQNLQTFGIVLGIGGALTSAVGAYYSVLGQRYQLRSQALSRDFEASIAGFNARAAERDAQALIQAGQQRKGLSTLRFGQLKAASRTRTAAAGVQAGVGSAAEVQASIEAVKEIDSLTIELNAVRAAGAARTRAVDFRNRALFARVSAANARRSAGALSPGLAAATSLLGGAGRVSSQFLDQERFNLLLQQRRGGL